MKENIDYMVHSSHTKSKVIYWICVLSVSSKSKFERGGERQINVNNRSSYLLTLAIVNKEIAVSHLGGKGREGREI